MLDKKARVCISQCLGYCCAEASHFLGFFVVILWVFFNSAVFFFFNDFQPLLDSCSPRQTSRPVLGSTVPVMESVFLNCMAILRWKVGRNFCNTFLIYWAQIPNQDMYVCVCVFVFFSF